MLVLDFQAGQPEAFVEIHKRYAPLAKHVCLRFLPNRHDADEAFQETMIRVFQGLHRFNGRYALQPWIARIATNVSLDHIRTRARRPQLDDEPIDEHERGDPAAGPEEAIERLIERDLVLSVLAGLPETHRTALVLRELEGRSHKEIAQALDITPAQAKALIHRAKGSFRREWLLAVTEKGGLAAIAILPLLWLAKGAEVARKVVDKVGGHATQVAQAATPEIVTSAANAPAVPMAATSMAERVVAAGVTLLVAGGVTVGAATIKSRIDKGKEERAAPSPAVVQPPVQTTQAPEVQVTPDAERQRPARERPEKGGDRGDQVAGAADDPAVVDPGASPSPGADPSPGTSPSPGSSPSPDATPTPPPIPPAPAFGFDVSTSTDSEETCACDGSASISPAQVNVIADGEYSFSHLVETGVRDASGDLAWDGKVQLWGHVSSESGTLDFQIILTTDSGVLVYSAGALGLVEIADDGDGTLYRFEGTFGLANAEVAPPGLPTSGFASVRLGIWADGTTYVGSINLADAAA
jgi:RNA polymerase sigma-70 factor (ECF subfamily)